MFIILAYVVILLHDIRVSRRRVHIILLLSCILYILYDVPTYPPDLYSHLKRNNFREQILKTYTNFVRQTFFFLSIRVQPSRQLQTSARGVHIYCCSDLYIGTL